MMENRNLRKYLIITFAASWTNWLVLALLVKNNIVTFSSLPGTLLFLFGGFAPTISAIWVREDKSFPAIMNFIFSRRKGSIFYLLFFCLLEFLTIGLSSMELNPAIPVQFIPVFFLICVLIGGGNEELGWRGTMQPVLEKKSAFPIATFITGIIWAVWHLPLWFVEGTTQKDIPFLLFAVYAVFLSFCLACVRKKTDCVFYCAVLHGFSNLLMSVFVLKVNLILAAGVVFMGIMAVLLGDRNGK